MQSPIAGWGVAPGLVIPFQGRRSSVLGRLLGVRGHDDRPDTAGHELLPAQPYDTGGCFRAIPG